MNSLLPIGGFFPLDLRNCVSDSGGLLRLWTGELPFSAFANARSALAALVAQLKPRRVWLPSFICNAVVEGVPHGLQCFYAISDALTADTGALAKATAGDMVLGVNYFGFGPDEDFLSFVAARPDLVFVEDCAHCVVSGTAWGDWRLFSPRKVVGVADGGILVGMRPNAVLPKPFVEANDPEWIWRAPLLRYEDSLQKRSAQWHPANQEKEANMKVSNSCATRLSLALLCLLDPQEIARCRRENFALLQATIGEYLLPLRETDHSVPFAFPVQLAPEQRDTVIRNLHANGIFAAVHWDRLPVKPHDFQQAHHLSQSLISLPCDQRYEAAHMDYITTIFRQVLK